MGMKDILEKLFTRKQQQEIPDDETKDKFLRSLRRQRRIQLEEGEKEDLQKDIRAFEKERLRRNLFGFKNDEQRREEKKNQLIKAVEGRKKLNTLKERSAMLGRAALGNNRAKRPPKGFLSRGNL